VQELVSKQQAACLCDDTDGTSADDFHELMDVQVLRPLEALAVGCVVAVVPASEFADSATLRGSTLEPCESSRLSFYLKVRSVFLGAMIPLECPRDERNVINSELMPITSCECRCSIHPQHVQGFPSTDMPFVG
jgi:hypothetical protein